MKRKLYSAFILIILIILLLATHGTRLIAATEIWQVRSVDTMKDSRDKAREKLNDKTYDQTINKELELIKNLGANYVAIDTPYDEEFIPYLTRWVNQAHKMGLSVWFRGNWSNWEGWFDYPKNLKPDEHIAKTAHFILNHKELFNDGDAFDPCPECENAGFWKQPDNDAEYNKFIIQQQKSLKENFKKINKKVHTNFTSIIGGRALEVLNKDAYSALNNQVTIDHYVKSLEKMDKNLDTFCTMPGVKVLLGEFGAPIPDINGDMTPKAQADFIDSMFNVFYKRKECITGINYYVLTNGTTAIINKDMTTRPAYEVVKKYFRPAIISGKLVNKFGDVIHGENITTNSSGNFSIAVPAGNQKVIFGGVKYKPVEENFTLDYGEQKNITITLEPINKSFIYKIREWIYNLNHKS